MRHRYAYTHGMTDEQRHEFYTERHGPDQCWPWTGTVTRDFGYGVFGITGRRQMRAHRMAYARAHPEVDMATVRAVDHICHTAECGTERCAHRLCQNPAHLVGTTNEGNVMRGESPAARNARKTHCKRGHEFDTVRVTPAGRVGRGCSQCRAIVARERRQRRT